MRDEFEAYHARLEEGRAKIRAAELARLKADGYRIVKLDPITLPRGFETPGSYRVTEEL